MGDVEDQVIALRELPQRVSDIRDDQVRAAELEERRVRSLHEALRDQRKEHREDMAQLREEMKEGFARQERAHEDVGWCATCSALVPGAHFENPSHERAQLPGRPKGVDWKTVLVVVQFCVVPLIVAIIVRPPA